MAADAPADEARALGLGWGPVVAVAGAWRVVRLTRRAPAGTPITGEDTAARVQAWASHRGLGYARLGLLPPVSELLRERLDFGAGPYDCSVLRRPGEMLIRESFAARAPRVSENLCGGALGHAFPATLAHHGFIHHRDVDGRWMMVGHTVVAARVPAVTRLTRELWGGPAPRGASPVVRVHHPEYGDDLRIVDLTPSLGDRFRWKVDVDEDVTPLRRLFEPQVLAALAAAPADTEVTMADGWLTVALVEAHDDPGTLDALWRLAEVWRTGALGAAHDYPGTLAAIWGWAAAGAGAALRAAAAEATLEPTAGPLGPSPTTRYREWLDAGVAQVTWHAPPPDDGTAVRAYVDTAQNRRAALVRALRGFAVLMAFFVVLGAVIGGVAALAAGFDSAILAMLITLAIGAVVAMVFARSLAVTETAGRAQVFGRAAFARSYAQSRGLLLEDPERLRRGFDGELPGRPVQSLYGDLGGGVRGRIVFWRDITDTIVGGRALTLALVPLPDGPLPPVGPPLRAERVGPWLMLVHDLGAGPRVAAHIDALRAEAVRCARAGAGWAAG